MILNSVNNKLKNSLLGLGIKCDYKSQREIYYLEWLLKQ